MAEHIKCRHCESPDCRGCNIYTLVAALERGYFDSLMDGKRAICIETGVRPIVKSEWVKIGHSDVIKPSVIRGRYHYCKACEAILDFNGYRMGRGYPQFCPHCGASMRMSDD